MTKIFFDIETIPCSEGNREAYLGILRAKNSNAAKSDEDMHTSMSFDGNFGRICCIAIIKEDEKGIIQKEIFSGEEKEILTKFWESAQGVHRFVGHNIWGFDLPFIFKRSIINGVRPMKINLARYRDIPVYDTMLEWELWNFGKATKLDTLAKLFGFPTSKDEMDGSQVWQYFQDGRIEEICKYCMKDVELTRKVYYRMSFDTTFDENSFR